MSGETAAIGLGFLAAGPVGAIIGGAVAPVALAAMMWRSRQAEHDENSNGNAPGNGASDRSGSGSGRGSGRTNGAGNRGRNNGAGGTGGGRHKAPKNGTGNGSGGGTNRKPKTKDPILDKLSKGLNDLKSKGGGSKGPKNKTPKDSKTGGDKAGKGPKGSTDKGSKDGKAPKSVGDANGDKTPKDSNAAKGLKDRLKLKDRGKQPSSERPWRARGDKPKKDQKNKSSDDTSSSTARDGLDPKNPKGDGGAEDQIVDAEIVDQGLPPKPDHDPSEVIDAEVIDEDRIALVREKREKAARRAAIRVGKRAAADAARDGTLGDPHTVKHERIRAENQWIDRELHREAQLLALVAGTEQRRSAPVTYPVATTQPTGTRTAGVAVARQIDVRGSSAYRLLVAMAEQLANGLHNDDDADMADHVVELVGIPAMCRNLSTAVREAAAALQKTAPLHPSVIKHLNNAAVAALTAARMADTIIVVFVQAHREDIYRVLQPRVGEERWNIRNAEGTLDGAKLRAAILSAGQQRLALPAGSSPTGATNRGSGKLVPASHGSTKKLINLMKGFDRGHMVVCLSEVAGSAGGVEVVADSVTRLYRRMAKSWPTEDVVDDTVRATASKVKTVAAELRKAVKAAQRAHARELKLNAKPRKGAKSESKWDVVRGRRG
ncbi:hypothetical protein [Streptomyces sp. ME19-01-6]|uniref:hypothetical protein n=1 Tax=Streptomyces sp. ME19-01-6 TaxID=3028686 RepID=UPI0029A4403C|nr:hypothetical protein [Streptomyces sp. ME19-01-6]MDX3232870.1 hypothetical protein [Streptomyces sp. ME19-01-6]